MFTRNGKFGYINGRGERVIDARFAGCWRFSEGLAEVRETPEGKSGYIDKKGEHAIPPRFDAASPFREGLALVRERDSTGFINPQGEWAIRGSKEITWFSSFSGGLAGAGKDMNGFIDKSGSYVIAPEYPQITAFSDGLAAVQGREGLWGYIDKKGKIAITFQYQEAYSFNSGIAYVITDGFMGYIGMDGKPVFRDDMNRYAWLESFSEGFGRVVKRGGLRGFRYAMGYMDAKGKEAIKPEFYNCGDFRDGMAPVCFKPNSRWGYVNTEGKIAIGMVYHVALPFSEGLAPVGVKGRGMGYINKEGNTVIGFDFGFAGEFSEGMAIFCD